MGVFGAKCKRAAVAIGAILSALVASPSYADSPQAISDAEVLGAIRKGVNYLLAQRKGNHWESKFDAKGQPLNFVTDAAGFRRPDAWPGTNFGGETSLVLYTLLHVGHGLQDDPELGPKLRFNSPELEPTVKWLSNEVTPDATYTAGLYASALALVPQRTDLGKVAGQGLRGAYGYVLGAMDKDGGYSYRAPGTNNGSPAELWRAWVTAGNKADADRAKAKLDEGARGSITTYSGLDGFIRILVADIKEREAAARAKRDTATLQRLALETRQLQAYTLEAQKLRANVANSAQRELVEARKRLAEAQEAKRTGEGWREVDKKDASGNVVRGPNGQAVKERIRKTPAEIDRDLADAEARMRKEEADSRNNFAPGGDLSNAQYGTLGAWALSDAAVEVPTDYWKVADRFWRLTQQSSGGWAYNPNQGNPRLSMTVAGLASLFITSEMVDTQIRLEPRPDKEIERGIAWLDANFQASSDGYAMYGVERVGLASGIKFFGTKDWYAEGARTIIRAQKEDGSIGQTHGSAVVNTAYCLLFLARGRNPVVFNKLEYAGPWNARPRDAANITEWMSKSFERPINWQVVNMKVDAEGWLDAPILLITGSRALNFGPEEIAKLRTYVQAGGMIFSTADGGKAEFTQSVVALASQVMNEKYEMREMSADHPLFSAQLWAEVKQPPRMLAMRNGIREVWIHSTVDMGASWQGRRTAQFADHFVIPAKLNQYATGKGALRGKLTPLAVAVSNKQPTRRVNMARLDYADNPDPEPGAWARLARIMANEAATALTIKTVKLSALDAKDTPLAHLTGTTRFRPTPEDVAALQRYIEAGGTLFVDAAGDSPAFRASAMDLIKAVLPDGVAEELPPSHPVLKGTLEGGVDVTDADYRKFARLKGNGLRTPQIMGFGTKGGRHAILYSEFDVTSGLLGTNTWGIVGYAPKTAEGLARNIVLQAAGAKPRATTAPSTQADTRPAAGG